MGLELSPQLPLEGPPIRVGLRARGYIKLARGLGRKYKGLTIDQIIRTVPDYPELQSFLQVYADIARGRPVAESEIDKVLKWALKYEQLGSPEYLFLKLAKYGDRNMKVIALDKVAGDVHAYLGDEESEYDPVTMVLAKLEKGEV